MSLWFWFLHVKFDSDLTELGDVSGWLLHHINCLPTSSEILSVWHKPLSKKHTFTQNLHIHARCIDNIYISYIYILYVYIYMYIYKSFFTFPLPKKKTTRTFFGGQRKDLLWNGIFPNSSGPMRENQPPMRISSLRMLSHKSPGIKNHQEIGKKKKGLQKPPRLRILEKNTSKKCHVCCVFLVLRCVYGERIHLEGFGNLFTQPF